MKPSSDKKTQPSSPSDGISWQRFFILFAIYILVIGLIQLLQYLSPEIQSIEGTLDLRSEGYFSSPPEQEVFELLHKLGSSGRTMHLVIECIDAFMFVPIYCLVHSYLWIKLGDGLWLPLMFSLVGFNALVDTIENLSIIVLLLSFSIVEGGGLMVGWKELASSTKPLMEHPTGQMMLKALARGLHYFTPMKFMLIGIFFSSMVLMTILSHFLLQANDLEEEEAKKKKKEQPKDEIIRIRMKGNQMIRISDTNPSVDVKKESKKKK